MARVKLTANNMCHRPVLGGEAIEALIEVSHQGPGAIAQWVLDGGDLNQVAAPSNGIGVLHALMRKNANAKDQAAARWLIEAGTTVDCMNSRGETPLLRAVLTRQVWAVQLLQEHGANWHLVGGKRMLSPALWLEKEMARYDEKGWDRNRSQYAPIQAMFRAYELSKALDQMMVVPSSAPVARRPRF